MKKIISQITAFALAICMLAALVPAVPVQAVETTEPATVTLNFDLPDTAWIGVAKINNSTYGSIPSVNNLAADVWSGWTLNTTLTSSSYKTYLNAEADKYQWNSLTYQDMQLNLNNDSTQAVAFDFNVTTAAYYDLSDVSLSNIVDGGKVYSGKVSIYVQNGVGVKTLLGTVDASTATFTMPDFGTVYLTAGTNTLLLAGAGNNTVDSNNRIKYKYFTFTETSAPMTEDVVLNFSDEVFGQETILTKVLDYGNWNWKYNAGETSSKYKTEIDNQVKEGNATNGNFKYRENVANENPGFYMALRGSYGELAMDFEVEENGWYVFDANKSDIRGAGAANTYITDVYVKNGTSEARLAATIDADLIDSGEKGTITANAVYLYAGTNQIIFKGRDAEYNSVTLRKITFTKTTLDLESEIFGDTFAYVKKNGDALQVYFVGGIKNINYAKVGFKVNGEHYYTNEVYESLKLGENESIATSKFGEDCQYVFHTEAIDVTDGEYVTVEAYVEDAQGNKTYYGKSFTAKISV